MNIKKMTTGKLKELAYSLHESINVIECFGTKDVIILEFALNELEKRGYKIQENKQLKIESR